MWGSDGKRQIGFVRSSLIFFSFAASLFAIVGFLGQAHRSIDTISMGQPVFGLICILGVFATKRIWFKLMFSTVAAATTLSVSSLLVPQKPGRDLAVYSKNLWFANSEIPALVSDIEASGVDVAMLQEVSDQNRQILKLLQKSFPYQHLCRFSGWSGIALVSRLPFDGQPGCSNSRAVLVAPVQVKNKRVWLVSAHIPWPWPHDSIMNEKDAESVISGLDGAIVVAGDFNVFPWSSRVSRIASMTNTQLAGPVRATLNFRHLPFPLDHVMAPGGGSLEVRPLLGSDHAGVVAKVTIWNPQDRD